MFLPQYIGVKSILKGCLGLYMGFLDSFIDLGQPGIHFICGCRHFYECGRPSNLVLIVLMRLWFMFSLDVLLFVCIFMSV